MGGHSKAASPGTTAKDGVMNPLKKGSKIPLPSTSSNSTAKSSGGVSTSSPVAHPETLAILESSATKKGVAKKGLVASDASISESPVQHNLKQKTLAQLNKNKPLPGPPASGPPAVNVTASSPLKHSKTLLDATEHPPFRQSPGTPEEKEWPALSPEPARFLNVRDSIIVSSSKRDNTGSIFFDGPSEASSTISSSGTAAQDPSLRSTSSPPAANRATLATFHKATVVINPSPAAASRRSIHTPTAADKNLKTPPKNRRVSDPGSPPSSIRGASVTTLNDKTGDRTVEGPYGQKLTIRKNADKIIFDGPPRKPTFTEVCNMSWKPSSPKSESSKCEILKKSPIEGNFRRNDDDSRKDSKSDTSSSGRDTSAPSSFETSKTKASGQDDTVAGAAEYSSNHDSNGQRGRSAESTPTKTAIQARSPTPHANTVGRTEGRPSRQAPVGGISTGTPKVNDPQPIHREWSNDQAQGAFPPRSDSLHRLHLDSGKGQGPAPVVAAQSVRPRKGRDAVVVENGLQAPIAIPVSDGRFPVSVAESSFEGMVAKARARADKSMAKSSPPTSFKPPTVPANTSPAMSQGAFHTASSTTLGDGASTQSHRLTRRDSAATTTGSQHTGKESHRSRSRGRKVISNIKDIFHRRANEQKEEPMPPIQAPVPITTTAPTVPKKSPLRINTVRKLNPPKASPKASPQPSPSSTKTSLAHRKTPFAHDKPSFTTTKAPTPKGSLKLSPGNFSSGTTTPSYRRDLSSLPDAPTPRNSITLRDPPASTPPKNYPPLSTTSTGASLNCTAMNLLERAKTEPDEAKKKLLMRQGTLLTDAVVNANEAQMAMVKAQAAAGEVEWRYKLVLAALVEMERVGKGVVSGQSREVIG